MNYDKEIKTAEEKDFEVLLKTPTGVEEWESELDQLILAHIAIQSSFHAGHNSVGDVDEAGNNIKVFVHQELQKAREEEIEKIRKEVEELEAPIESKYDLEAVHDGFFIAIEAVQKYLTLKQGDRCVHGHTPSEIAFYGCETNTLPTN